MRVQLPVSGQRLPVGRKDFRETFRVGTRVRAMSAPPVLGSATARIVGRRRCSKRLAFYDLRELIDVSADVRAVLDSVARLHEEKFAETEERERPENDDAAANPECAVELVAKAHTVCFSDELALAVAQKTSLKLGNVVRVFGSWTISESHLGGRSVELNSVTSIEVLSRWQETNPGEFFQKLTVAGVEVKQIKNEGTRTKTKDKVTNEGTHSADSHDTQQNNLPCKFWINQGQCHKGSSCRFAHSAERGAEAKKWIGERRARRRAAQVEEMKRNDVIYNEGSDAHDTATGTGTHSLKTKSHRAAIFATWLVDTFGLETLRKGTGVLDVAGGRGDVSWELFAKLGVPCTLVEPRQRKLNKAQHRWMKQKLERGLENKDAGTDGPDRTKAGGTEQGMGTDKVTGTEDGTEPEAPDLTSQFLCPQIRAEFCGENFAQFKHCSVIVGMHPDQATEVIAEFALLHDKPFAIVPCCVFPTLFPDRRVWEAGENVPGLGGETEVETNGKEIAVAKLGQLVTYLAAKLTGQVACLDFEGANRVVFGGNRETTRRGDETLH